MAAFFKYAAALSPLQRSGFFMAFHYENVYGTFTLDISNIALNMSIFIRCMKIIHNAFLVLHPLTTNSWILAALRLQNV